jgi:hypothetical protein
MKFLRSLRICLILTLSVLYAGTYDGGNLKELRRALSESTGLQGPYLGQALPGLEAVIFAPDVISTKEHVELTNTFTPDGKEFYFTRRIKGKDAVMVSRWEKDGWTVPEVAPFFKKYQSFEQHVSLDGTKMFITRFAKPPEGVIQKPAQTPQEEEAQMVNIWVMERTADGWSEPTFCVNGMYVTTTNDGSIYTTDIRGPGVIAKSRFIDGKYTELEKLGGGVNSPMPGAHPCVAPDESFIIFDSRRPMESDDPDLYVCFRQKDGTWGEAMNLGDKINTSAPEIAAALSPDGKYLFYQSRGDIYWVSTRILESFKPSK